MKEYASHYASTGPANTYRENGHYASADNVAYDYENACASAGCAVIDHVNSYPDVCLGNGDQVNDGNVHVYCQIQTNAVYGNVNDLAYPSPQT